MTLIISVPKSKYIALSQPCWVLCFTTNNILCNRIHNQFSHVFLILVFSKKYIFLNLKLYKASLPANVCTTAFVHLFPVDIVSNVANCVGEQILGIELLNFFGHQCQM